MITQYIIISIIGSITNLLPISYSTHIYIYQNLFNTNIFNNTTTLKLIYPSILISIIYIYKKEFYNNITLPIKYFLKKDKTKYKKQTKKQNIYLITSILSTIIIYLIPKLKLTIKNTPIYLIILTIIIILSTNKKGIKKTITIKDSLIFSISHIINIIPSISPICSNILVSKLLNFNKQTSLKYSLLTLIPTYIIESIYIIKNIIINSNTLPYYLLTILISTIINIKIINYLKDIYYNNKMYKLGIYTFILALFLLYWYR